MAEAAPPQITRLIAALSAIPGVADPEIDRIYLPDIAVADLSLPGFFAFLPIAALRRSDGALPDELLLSINFTIERSETGLLGLEFLAWWARDQSRGGENMQIRALGLPPRIGDQVQLGQSLRFTIDWFYADPSQDIGKLLAAIEDKAKSIELGFELYESCFGDKR